MIVTKIYVVPSGGEGMAAPRPPPEVATLCTRMIQRSPNWGYRTDIKEIDEPLLFAIAQAKYAFAGGLPLGFQLDWSTAAAHSVNPNNPTQWIRFPPRAGLRFTVTSTNSPDSFVFVVFEQEDWAGAVPFWEEAPVNHTP